MSLVFLVSSLWFLVSRFSLVSLVSVRPLVSLVSEMEDGGGGEAGEPAGNI